MDNRLEFSPEAAAARADRKPLVALESTIIAHGFPYPDNLALAAAVEAEIRARGAVPATIAVLDGVLRVGLTAAELERIATDPGLPKASTRDLPVLVGLRRSAATTVATTAQIAVWAGIDVFVTGGIGGVHRGWASTLDISADLTTLARLPLAIVCAGAKTVLDVPATLEYLETAGVTTVGFGTDTFPGFYIRSTGHPVDARADTAAEAADVLQARQQLGLPGAVLVTNPVPAADALPDATVEAWLATATAEAEAGGVRGRDVTPFLLKRLHELSNGATVKANRALVLANARVGADLAVALADRGGAAS